MKIRSIALLLASAVVTGCDGLREALTAHVDVVAKAEDQELPVERAGNLLGNTTLQIPVNRETAMIVADLWANYQLLGHAAANHDSLNAPELVDEATFGITANARLRRYMDGVNQRLGVDSASETTYNQATGDLFVARHILFPFPGGMTQEQKDSVRRRAEQIRAQTTTRNFADMARRYSSDGAQAGGNLGAFQRAQMVKPFGDAVAALRPGDISAPIETQFGYHIIYRPAFAEARAEYVDAFRQRATQRAESTYLASIESAAGISVRGNAGETAKEAASDIPAHRDDDDVLASFKGGELTVKRFLQWVEAFPPQARIAQQLAQPSTPDSLVALFVENIARNEVLLQKADSAGIVMTPDEIAQLRREFQALIIQIWQTLGVDPLMLADSARTAPERERLAANRIEAYMDRMMRGEAQPLTVPPPVEVVLAEKYSRRINPAGVDRAVEHARRIRSAADSTRASQQPPTQVPMPGTPTDTTPRP